MKRWAGIIGIRVWGKYKAGFNLWVLWGGRKFYARPIRGSSTYYIPEVIAVYGVKI